MGQRWSVYSGVHRARANTGIFDTHINRYRVTGTTAEESGGEIRGRTGPDHNKAVVKLDGPPSRMRTSASKASYLQTDRSADVVVWSLCKLRRRSSVTRASGRLHSGKATPPETDVSAPRGGGGGGLRERGRRVGPERWRATLVGHPNTTATTSTASSPPPNCL